MNLTEHEIHLINFLPDFWDMIEAYHLFAPKEGGRERRSATAPRPSCSVIIKHLPEKGDIYFAHNAWHEYRAMTYRYTGSRMLFMKTHLGGKLFTAIFIQSVARFLR